MKKLNKKYTLLLKEMLLKESGKNPHSINGIWFNLFSNRAKQLYKLIGNVETYTIKDIKEMDLILSILWNYQNDKNINSLFNYLNVEIEEFLERWIY